MAAKRAERAEMTSPGPVMDAAAAFLAVRPRSVAETTRRLRHLGYPDQLVEQVVGQLVALNYLDDKAFARTWVESRDRARPRGELALRRELAQKGVGREIVDQVLAERQESHADGETDLAAALRLLERRRSTLEREPETTKRRQRAYALLARNGFDPDTCRSAAAAWLNPP
jgi:regulatory protein